MKKVKEYLRKNMATAAILSALFLAGFSLAPQLGSLFAGVGKAGLGLMNVQADDISEDPFFVRNEQVEKFMDLYRGHGSGFFNRALAKSTRYLPEIKRIFAEYGIPEALAYVALIESGYNNTAVSKARATGMWQFMMQTGSGYGLQVNSWVDERRDFYKASHAAARHFRDLYADFGDWLLALAAYNAGSGYVRAKMRETGAKDFWTLNERTTLYKETAEYVPRFLAARILARHPEAFGISGINFEPPIRVARIWVRGGFSIAELALELAISPEELKDINPQLHANYLPRIPGGFELNVPAGLQVPDGSTATLVQRSQLYAGI